MKDSTKPGKAKKPSKRKTGKAVAKNKGGRPSTFKQATIETICLRLAKGEPLAAICREEGMPGVTTVWEWEKARPDVSEAIARARIAGEEWIAAECLLIADTPMPGRVEKQELLGVLTRDDQDGNKQQVALPDAQLVTTEVRIEDMLGHRKLQIETRLKLLAKWNPRKWGEKLDLTHKGTLTLEQLVSGSHDAGE